MHENDEPWEKDVPPDLIPPIKHLRKLFDDSHWKCGRITQILCFSQLHKDIADEETKEYLNPLQQLKVIVGPAATQQFRELFAYGTPSAIFKAFYDLYLEGVGHEALRIFKELIEVGRANEERLGISHLEWAEGQAKDLIRYHAYRIEIWVRDVCDKQGYDPNEDEDEQIFWRKWQAPMLLVMKPSRFMPYDAATVWERNEPETSARWLKSFAEAYVLHLEMKVRRAAGDAALELAKQPKPILPITEGDDSQQGVPASPANSRAPSNFRREARKLDTQAMYK